MVTVKQKYQIDMIRTACQITARVRDQMRGEIRPGVATNELDRRAEALIRAEGAEPAFKGYRGYRYATCISVNQEVVHGIPSERKLEEGDIVGFDVGVRYHGYYGDSAVTVPVGQVSAAARKLMKCTEEALYLAIDVAHAGKHVGDMSAVIEAHAAKNGYTVVRDLFGHGVGLELHEEPLIPNFGVQGEGHELKPGMIFAIEPMFNMGGYEIRTKKDGWTVVTNDQKLSAHFEHTIVVTEDKAEILTRV